MKVKSIKSIKHYGIFSDYQKDTTKDFGKNNVIFGWNYSGKTTLSRIFRSLEIHQQPSGFENCKFKIELDNSSELSELDILNNNLKIRTFNSDYIRDNLRWEQPAFGIQPILIVGDEDIKLQDELKILRRNLEDAESKIKNTDKDVRRIESELSTSLTTEATRITQELSLGRNFRKPDLENLIKNQNIKQWALTEEEFSNLKSSALSNDKLDPVFEITISPNKNIITDTKDLLAKTVTPSKTIERLSKNSEIENWVRNGRDLHKGKNKCEFCQNDLPKNLLIELDSHFSKDYESFRKEVEDFAVTLRKQKIITDNILKNKKDFYPEFQNDYLLLKEQLEATINIYNDTIEKLLIEVNKKVSQLPNSLILDNNISCDFDEINNATINFNKIINKNETRTKNFDDLKTEAKEKLKKYYAYQFYITQKCEEKRLSIKSLDENKKTIISTKDDLNLKIQNIEIKISESVKGAENLNNYIKRYFGTNTPIEIKVINNQFHIFRDDVCLSDTPPYMMCN